GRPRRPPRPRPPWAVARGRAHGGTAGPLPRRQGGPDGSRLATIERSVERLPCRLGAQGIDVPRDGVGALRTEEAAEEVRVRLPAEERLEEIGVVWMLRGGEAVFHRGSPLPSGCGGLPGRDESSPSRY